MPPPAIPPNRPSSTNPFYAQSGTSTPPLPSYSAQPAQYSSLSDLTKGRPTAQQHQSFEYVPQPERQGYNSQAFDSGRSGSPAGAGGRRVPPVPKEGMMPEVPPAPPRRNQVGSSTATPPPVPPRATSGYRSYIPAGAQGSVDSASRMAGSGFEKAKDGFNTIATQQRKEQVLSGIGKLGAGAVKLGAKGVYQVGKFATK
ncbi:hypothetical protein IAT38_002119 [Cryptococcus sp. DSM 104549]